MGGSGGLISKVVGAGLMIAGLFTGGVTSAMGMALMAAGVAVQVAGSLIFKPKLPSMNYRDTSERKQMLRSSSAPETVIVGKTVISGLLFFAEEETGEQDENEKITLALALAGHPIEKIGKIWLGDDLIETFGDKASWELHNDRENADPFMLKNCPSWKEDMIGRGMAWLRVTLTFDQEKFPYGLPNVKCEVWGKHLFDPRTGQIEWSNNGALVILDYYRHYLKVPDTDIDFDSFKQAADLCDEKVSLPEGGFESRYTLNGAYDLNESPSSILEAMHKCINAEPTFTAGKHGIQIGAYYGPAIKTITESQLIGTVTCTPETGLKDATNAVYGTFIDAEQLYTKTDFTPVIVDEWVKEDGLEIRENIDYRFVTSPYQAQRLARQYLRKKKAGRRVQLTMNLDGYAYRPGEVVLLALPSLGISGLEFRIAEWSFHALDGVALTLEEDGAYLYEDVISKPFERPPFVSLPAGGVASPINLTFVPLAVSDIIQGTLSWQNVASDVRYNTVTILQEGNVIQSIQVPAERVDINGLARGTYRVEVRATNVAGAMSAPVISDFAIQAPPPPEHIDVTSGLFNLTIAPKQGDSAVFGYTFEFWFSEEKLADLSENEVITKTNKVGQGNFWTQENLKAGHTYYFYVRTINSYGKSPFVEASGTCSSQTDLILEELAGQISRDQLAQDLLGEINSKADQSAVVELNTQVKANHDAILAEQVARGAVINQEQQARAEADKAEAQQRQFLATQLRGDYTGNDLSKVTAGLISAEKQARVTGDQTEAKARQSLETRMNGNVSAINKSLETLTSKQQAQTQEISTLNSNLKGKADSSAVNALNTRVSNIDGKVTSATSQVQTLSSKLDKVKADLTESVVVDLDLSKLNENTYYPVILPLVTSRRYAFKVFRTLGQYSDNKPSYATHSTKGFAMIVEWQVSGSGWGTQSENRIIDNFDWKWTNQSPVMGPAQLTNGSVEYIYLRGGAKYQLTKHKSVNHQIITSTYTNNKQSVAPKGFVANDVPKSSEQKANATANAVSQLETKVTEVSGKVTSTAQQVTRLESQVGTSSAKIEQTSKVVTDINGKISASWTMKVQQDSKGNKVITGIGLGFNAQGNSQFLVNAQNFAVISSLNGKVVTPFVIQNGQAFFNDALFSKATIDKLSVGKKITSTNYLAGKKGFNIDATTGNVELNDAVFRGRLDINSGGTKGRLVITNNTIYVYDENNQLAAKIGYLG
ncbi:phage tail protein [Proteus penneri]|uniref:Fibronectin type III domain protein n=1 Tax=Proteus penneri TaxID=102862 RepID=A0A0G4Q025_9GAMM|nr:phage tail protein [Proteus penneri]CRL59016.1 Fibronectin type III domain protein [Proteus penneri]